MKLSKKGLENIGFRKKVLVSGSFDLIHPGHLNFFKSAKKHGHHLTIIVARDSIIKQVKGRKPKYNEKQRLKHVKETGFADEVMLGYKRNKMKILEKIKPDIICLGYDQKFFIKELKDYIKDNKLKIKIKRLRAYKPHIYKSSKLKLIQKP